jgi:hypothetical protein
MPSDAFDVTAYTKSLRGENWKNEAGEYNKCDEGAKN